MGKEYLCRKESQNEFVYHFNLPSSDIRHPSQGILQQEGIYSSHMFNKDTNTPNGIHLITLDARYHRSPTYSTYGPCEGAASSMLGATQWAWLQQELNKPSEIKIIGSGVQVLPPTNQNIATSHCAYDGPSGTFDAANIAVGEGPGFPAGTIYEQWGEMPQERTKLLHMCQESINAGKTKQIIFLSGDQHWAEIMVKKVPARTGQAAVTLYEVTASGIDQNYIEVVNNANRFRPRLANTNGSGPYVNECMFPFTYQGVEYSDCTSIDNAGIDWCYYNSANGQGNCQPKSDMVVPTARSTSTKLNICSGQAMHVCSATANYGSIDVNWVTNEVTMNICTPHQTAKPLAASVTIPL
jgi:alkaline phosphatase D